MTPRRDTRQRATSRAQANLAVLGVALLLMTTVTGMSLVLADSALAGADRTPTERHAANAIAERLVAAESPTTHRANVLDATIMSGLTPRALDRLAPAGSGYGVRVQLDDRTVLERGTVRDGTTVRRIVLVANQRNATQSVPLSSGGVTLPRRTSQIRLVIQPDPGTTVETVRANDRILLHNTSGLRGSIVANVSRLETTTLTFVTDGSNRGTVHVTYYPTRTTKAILVVTVDE